MRAVLARLLVLWLAAAAACVVIPDPDHCANQGGDATCVELELGEFCSSCKRGNRGCVEVAPAQDCQPTPVGETSASSAPTSSSTEPTSGSVSETGLPACDPACGVEAPYCLEGQCTTCSDAGGDVFCASSDSANPQCHPTWGTCAACVVDGSPACQPDAQFCDDSYACGGCTEHAQCPASACDLEMGRCMDDAPQLWVDNDNETCAVDPMGTEESPYCTVAEALAVIGAADTTAVIRVASGVAYNEGLVWSDCANDRRLAVIGTGAFDAVLQADPNVVDVRCANVLYLANLRLSNGMTAGIFCQDATVWLDDAMLLDDDVGLDASSCRVHVRRTQILRSTTFGIRTSNNTDLWLASSIVGSGGTDGTTSRAIEATSGMADIRFTTVAGNRGDGKNSLWCAGGIAGSVRNSIFASEGGGSVDCPQLTFANTAFDDPDLAMAGTDNVQVLYDASRFVDPSDDDYHLGPAAPMEYLAGGRWDLGDPRRDLDRQPRVAFPGAAESLGADTP